MKSFRKIGLLALALSAVACGLPDEWDNTPYTPHPVTPEPEEPGVVEFTATVPTKTSLDECALVNNEKSGYSEIAIFKSGVTL